MMLSKNSLWVLESLTKYLHDAFELEFYKISKLLKKDNRTIWTCYNRSTVKLQNSKENNIHNIWRNIR